VCAVAGGRMLYLWWRMDEEGRRRVWSLYGWFCGLMVCGSCFGAVTWAARMMMLANVFNSNDADSRGDRVQQLSLLALGYSWFAVFFAIYGIDFLCLSAARLMVLDRMSEFAAGQDEVTRKRWATGGRVVMAVVVLGNAAGLAANVAAAVHVQRAAEAASTASELFAANITTQVAREYESLSRSELQLSNASAAIQGFCEVAVLLLIVVAFVVVGVTCARIISSRLLAVDASSTPAAVGNYIHLSGRELRRQIVVTTAVVFIAFVIRSVQSTMFAVARQLQDQARRCPGVTGLCDASCNNVFTHILTWMVHTPEFQVTIVLLSSPLTLLVALWGMTTRQMLQTMKSKEQEVPLKERV
jgi:hypothetical protein